MQTTDERGFGWSLFAGSMIILGGFFNIVDGLVAIFDANYYASIAANNSVHLPVTDQLHTWGWVAFIIGIVMVVIGFAIYARQNWARVAGIVLAGANAIFQLAFMAAFPFWSFSMILVDAAVIYGLTVSARGEAY